MRWQINRQTWQWWWMLKNAWCDYNNTNGTWHQGCKFLIYSWNPFTVQVWSLRSKVWLGQQKGSFTLDISIIQWWQNKKSNLYLTLVPNLLKMGRGGLILLNPKKNKPTSQSNVLACGMTPWSPARKQQFLNNKKILLQKWAPSVMDIWVIEFQPHRYEWMWFTIHNTHNKFSLMKIWNKY